MVNDFFIIKKYVRKITTFLNYYIIDLENILML